MKTIAVKLIKAPNLQVSVREVNELKNKIIKEEAQISLTIKKTGFDGWDPVYELDNPDQQSATSLAAVKAARSLKPNQYSHISCAVL